MPKALGCTGTLTLVRVLVIQDSNKRLTIVVSVVGYGDLVTLDGLDRHIDIQRSLKRLTVEDGKLCVLGIDG